jgi:hypothetical protein
VAFFQFFGVGSGLKVFLEGVLTDVVVWPTWRDGSFIYGGCLRILVCHVDSSFGLENSRAGWGFDEIVPRVAINSLMLSCVALVVQLNRTYLEGCN